MLSAPYKETFDEDEWKNVELVFLQEFFFSPLLRSNYSSALTLWSAFYDISLIIHVMPKDVILLLDLLARKILVADDNEISVADLKVIMFMLT